MPRLCARNDAPIQMLTWRMDDTIEIPEVTSCKIFHSDCVNDARLLFCLTCGKDDKLVPSSDAWVCSIPGERFITSTKCVRCNANAIITPSRDDLRKRDVRRPEVWHFNEPVCKKQRNS